MRALRATSESLIWTFARGWRRRRRGPSNICLLHLSLQSEEQYRALLLEGLWDILNATTDGNRHQCRFLISSLTIDNHCVADLPELPGNLSFISPLAEPILGCLKAMGKRVSACLTAPFDMWLFLHASNIFWFSNTQHSFGVSSHNLTLGIRQIRARQQVGAFIHTYILDFSVADFF